MLYRKLSPRQLLAMTWWNRPNLKGKDAIICDGAVRSGKTVCMTDGVQITAVHNLGKKAGYNGRKWTKHGKLPWITYEQAAEPVPVKPDAAKSFTKSYSGTWTVKSAIGLKLRRGASTSKAILETMPNGSKFRCYGYHTGQWLYGISQSGKEGYCHKSLLVR